MQLTPLGSFGVEVSGLDLSGDLDPSVAKTVVDIVAEHHVVVFRKQKLEKAEYDRFGRFFGNPIDFFFTPDLDKDWPALIRITNSPSHDPARQNGAAFWHTDGSYEHLPGSFTMLYALEAPEQGGETKFADLTAAYEALPQDKKDFYETVSLRHMLIGGKRGPDETPLKLDPDGLEKDDGVRARKRAAEKPEHPLIITHPITGRKSFYAVGGTPFEVVGMDADAGEALLDEVKAWCLQPQFIIEAKATQGDVLIWDNHNTMHRATPIEHSNEEGKRRSLLRISTNGLPPAYADRKPAFEKNPDIEIVRFIPGQKASA